MAKTSLKQKIDFYLFGTLVSFVGMIFCAYLSLFLSKYDSNIYLLTKNEAILESILTSIKTDFNKGGLSSSIRENYTLCRANYINLKESGVVEIGLKKEKLTTVDNRDYLMLIDDQIEEIESQIGFISGSNFLHGESVSTSFESTLYDNISLIKANNKSLLRLINKEQNRIDIIRNILIALFAIAFVSFLMMVFYTTNKNIFKYLVNVRRSVSDFKHGNLNSLKELKKDKGLVSDLVSHIDVVGRNVEYATRFAKEIGNGNLNTKLEIDQENDSLGKALEDMRSELKSYSEQEAKRIWVTEGVAVFSEILRNNNDIEELSEKLISKLVQYMGASLGGVYLLLEEEGMWSDPYLEMKSCYAYDKTRNENLTVYAEDSLLGRVILDKRTIFLTDIPDDFVSISSGLGKASPKCVLIVPLLTNDVLQGAIEIGSFDVFDQYKIEFVENIANSIASSIATVKMNTNTKKLLNESQQLTLKLQRQEEEVRKNMSNLKEAQQEMQMKQVELDGVFGSINQTLSTMDFSVDGKILSANHNALNLVGYDKEDIIGQLHSFFLREIDVSPDEYKQFWDDLSHNLPKSGDYNWICKGGKNIWIDATFTPVKDTEGVVFKVIMLAKNITDKKQEELEFKRLSIVTNNTDNSVIITSREGYIEYVNNGFTKLTGYTSEEVIGKKPGALLQGEDTNPQTVQRIKEKLHEGISFYEEILNYAKDGRSYWISLAINPVRNDEGELEKFVSVQTDITDTKSMAIDFSSKLNAITKSNVVFEMNLEGKFEEVNEHALASFGFSQEDFLTKKHQDLVSKEQMPEKEYEFFWNKLKSGEFVKDEFFMLGKRGKGVWLRGIYNTIQDFNGRLHKVVFFGIDITDERKLRIASLKKELELKENAKAINETVASVEFDMDGYIKSINDIFMSVSGYNEADLIGQKYTRLLSDTEIAKPQHELMWENLRQGKYFSGEFKILSKSGKDLFLNSTYNPIRDDGKPKKVMMFGQFTTDEKAKEIDLNATVKALKNSLPVFEMKIDGSIKSANNLFMELMGYKRLELRNLTYKSLLSKKELSQHESLLESLASGDFQEKLVKLSTKDAKELVCKITYSPIKNLESEIEKVVCIMILQN